MAEHLNGKKWMVRIGNFVEESISKGIYELGQEAPVLVGEPQEKVVALPVKDPFHIIRNLILIIELLS